MREKDCFPEANLRMLINQLPNLQWYKPPHPPPNSCLIPEAILKIVEYLELNWDWAGDVVESLFLYKFLWSGSMEELLDPVVLWLTFAAFFLVYKQFANPTDAWNCVC